MLSNYFVGFLADFRVISPLILTPKFSEFAFSDSLIRLDPKFFQKDSEATKINTFIDIPNSTVTYEIINGIIGTTVRDIDWYFTSIDLSYNSLFDWSNFPTK